MEFAYFGREPFTEMNINLCEELNKVGIVARPINWDDIQIKNTGFAYRGEHFVLPKVAMVESKVRTRLPKNQLRFIYNWLYLMEKLGVSFINTVDSTRNAFNKVYAASLLASSGVNTPDTCFGKSLEDISDRLKDWKDIIIKPLSGHSSVRLHRLIYDKNHPNKINSALTPKQDIECWHMIEDLHTICIQRYIPNKGRDIRVEVLNDRVLTIFAKYAQPNSWRVVDINTPSKITPFELTEEIEKTAIKATKALDLTFASIDFVESSDGLSVIEINPSPSSLYSQVAKLGLTIDPNGTFKYYIEEISKILNTSKAIN